MNAKSRTTAEHGRISVDLRNIKKTFGGVSALRGVNLQIREGEVHGLIGENGAGKSTLIKILTGVYRMDSGELTLYGDRTRIDDPVAARSMGVAAMYQESSVIDHLTVAQNLFLGHEPTKGFCGFVDQDLITRRAEEYLEPFGIDLDPSTPVNQLGLGQKRLLEILKAVSTDARVLVMDEATSGMSKAEIDALFRVMDDLKKNNTTMIYISHHLEEVFRVCDRVSVLRDGMNVGTFDTSAVTVGQLITAMAGKDVSTEFPARLGHPSPRVLLEADDFMCEGMHGPISFTLHEGEILGITGIVGAGKSELGLGLFGAAPRKSGVLRIRDRETQLHSPGDARESGIAYIPEDRKSQGLLLDLAVEDNITLVSLDKAIPGKVLVSNSLKRELAVSTSTNMRVVPPDVSIGAGKLSGGNQQKVVLGKWLSADPEIVIMDEPTRGIDVAAKVEIYRLIQRLADRGLSVILLSSEFKEVIGLSDKIIVLRDGSPAAEVVPSECSIEKILSMALGAE